MRKILSGIFFMALAGTLSIAAPSQDHDNGKHKGRDKHEDRGDDGDRHDNGNHKGWDNPHNPHYRDWDSDGDRIRPGRAHPYRRYDHVRADFIARTIDYRTRRLVLYDQSYCVLGGYRLDHLRDFGWERHRVYLYD